MRKNFLSNNPQLAKLARLIRYHSDLQDPDIDWIEAFTLWRKKRKKNTIGIRKEPRPYRQRANTMNCRAKSKGIEGTITEADLVSIMSKYNHMCVNCKTRDHLVFDHKISYFNGGTNTPDNLQVLCRICNMLKGAS